MGRGQTFVSGDKPFQDVYVDDRLSIIEEQLATTHPTVRVDTLHSEDDFALYSIIYTDIPEHVDQNHLDKLTYEAGQRSREAFGNLNVELLEKNYDSDAGEFRFDFAAINSWNEPRYLNTEETRAWAEYAQTVYILETGRGPMTKYSSWRYGESLMALERLHRRTKL